MYYNARSLIPKYDKLCVTMVAHNPGMICIVETWLCDDILNIVRLPYLDISGI